MKRTSIAAAIALAGLAATGVVLGSSHREAPMITKYPKVDNTDVYMFRSYEPGRAGYVTLIANFQPFEEPFGGPNYYLMDDKALYTINIDNNGDAAPDISFYFRFANNFKNRTVPVGGKNVPVPVLNIGPFGASSSQNANLNIFESYGLAMVRDGKLSLARNLSLDTHYFHKPFDNVGMKSVADYDSYANRYVYRVGLKGCAGEARVFVGQRREGFSVNVGEIFDLVNYNPLGARDSQTNDLIDKNVTSIAMEVPIACLTRGSDPVIGAWSTAYMPRNGRYEQVSRLSAPLVNEIVIGLPDKDRFNQSSPRQDAQFAKYVTNPTLPVLIQTLYPSVTAPTRYPRTDLVAAFLTGVDGLNKPARVRPAEMMRLNTSIAPKPPAEQDPLGVLAGDTAGFPNGRRPGDDVVDIELRVAMGALLPKADAPSGDQPFTDGAPISATQFRNSFPYLNTPIPGSPSEARPTSPGPGATGGASP